MTPPRHCHDQPDRTGILLVNLGTPDSPERGAVRRYLKEFLWDPRVVEAPRLLRPRSAHHLQPGYVPSDD